MESPQAGYQQISTGHLDLLCAFEGLPVASPQAMDFLCTWPNNNKPGGLLATLRERGLADSLKASALYEFAEQALLHIEFKLDNDQTLNDNHTLLNAWLGFLADHADWGT